MTGSNVAGTQIVTCQASAVMRASLPSSLTRSASAPVELARTSNKPQAEVAKELGISRSCLQNWIRQANTDENGSSTELTSVEKKELAELRRKNRQLEVENEILKRTAAYFARENVLPK